MQPQRNPVTPEAVVDVALALMDEGGLEAVSFRRIATELGVSAPTLYWHVDSKRRLMDLMAEELIHRTGSTPRLPMAGEPWWEWLHGHASRMFEALIATRDAPRVLAGNRPTPQSLPHNEQVLGVLVGTGMSAVEAQQTLFVIGSYVIGSATEWQAEAERARALRPADVDAGTRDTVLRGRLLADYPLLRQAIDGLRRLPHRAAFDHGLDLIVAGLRAQYDPAAGSRPARATGGAAVPPGRA